MGGSNHLSIFSENRWRKEAGLDQLKFTRAMSSDLPIFMASIVFPPELYHASIAWIQNSILTIIVDDFFDGGGSTQELENLVTLIEKYYKNIYINTLASVALEN